MSVALIDYNMGNLGSVAKALEFVGASARVVADGRKLNGFDCCILPGVGNFGDGMENLRQRGFDRAIREFVASGGYLLGICLGMQMCVVEFARDVLGLKDAISTEVNPATPVPIIDLMEDQKSTTIKGGTMRLGAYDCRLDRNSLAYKIYGTDMISERHRHRYEFNNDYLSMVEAAGMGDKRSFFADWTVRHPSNENGELLQHCGPWPISCASCEPTIGYPLAFNHPGAVEAQAKLGDMTLARFDGDNGKYSLLLGKAKGIKGPYTKGTYVWVEVKNLKRLEAKIVEGPYIHHCVGIHKDVVPVLFEACKYIGIEPDLYDDNEEEIKAYIRGE